MAQPLTPVLEPPLDQRIRHGAWATFLVVLGSHLFQVLRGTPPFAWQALLDLPIVAGLAFGLYRKSRAAAIGILLYFAATAGLQFVRLHTLPLGPYIILAFFLGRAIPAVFQYHRPKEQPASSTHVA